jgi:hypothetical protein
MPKLCFYAGIMPIMLLCFYAESNASIKRQGQLAGWLAGEPSQPSGDSLLVFLQSVFTHELRAGILDLT